jgi:phosphotransferase system HPr (HPr) family protein
MSMPEINLTVTNKVGLHARPASLFVQAASKFKSNISVQNGETYADAKSILEILMLGVNQGCEIRITAEGEDAALALEALKSLHAANFGEKE